jgi:hypothetical protein
MPIRPIRALFCTAGPVRAGPLTPTRNFARPARAPYDVSRGDDGLRPNGNSERRAADLIRTALSPVEAGQETAIADLQKATELTLRLENAQARPTATQLFPQTHDANSAQAFLSQTSAGNALNIALAAGPTHATDTAIAELRRRLAAKGVTIARLQLVGPDELPPL